MRKSIISKTFIKDLEKILIESNELTFCSFDNSLWSFLYSLDWNYKVRLFNQLEENNLTNKKTSIENIRFMIYKSLKIDFILK